jgi:RNA polymerase sigma-70 factor, ECF subfamily
MEDTPGTSIINQEWAGPSRSPCRLPPLPFPACHCICAHLPLPFLLIREQFSELMEEKRPAQQQYVHRSAAAAAPGDRTSGEAAGVPDDSELLLRCARGDQAAQHALIERHGRYLYGVAYSLTRDEHDAEDLVQETLLAAFRTKFRGESSLRTWLVKILVRRAGMLRRSRGRGPGVLSLNASETSSESAEATVAGGAGADARLDLSVMLSALSPEHRQVIVLRELEGLSYEEISACLGIPRGTVESRLHRAREELRKRFKDYGGLP